MHRSDGILKLLEPRSIAVVGASERPGAGRYVLENLDRLGFSGAILPVNPKYDTVLGRPCFPSLAEATRQHGDIDAVAILLGRERITSVVREAAEVGVRAAWAFASGFFEAGDAGRRLQAELVDACREADTAFCGPNCVGYANPRHGTALYSAPLPDRLEAGRVGFVSQSGSICLALANSARHIGFRLLASTGNEAVLDCTDYIRYLIEDPDTRVIGAFIEQLRRPDAFVGVAEEAREAGKPLVVLKVGRSEMARRATAAHTGALAGEDAIYDALFDKHGIVRVEDLDELIETVRALDLLGDRLPAGNRVAMLTLSGGEISLIGDIADGLDLAFPDWSSDARDQLAQTLPEYADISNPLDAWGGGRIEETYRAAIDAAVREDVDVVVVSQDAPPGVAATQREQFASVAQAAATANRESRMPIVAISHLSGGLDRDLQNEFERGGVPLLQGTRQGLRALQHVIHYAAATRRPAKPVRPDSARWQPPAGVRGLLDESRSREVLVEAGVPFVDGAVCDTEQRAVDEATRLGYPVVLKGVAGRVAHKTEAGLVCLELQDENAVREAFRSVRRRMEDLADAGTVLVQRMATGAVAEVILGMVRDPSFGPTVVFGLGGTFVEVFKDRAVGLPPLDREDARRMIAATRVARLLEGVRGGPPGDVDALIDALVAFGEFAWAGRGAIDAMEINPLLVLPQGEGVVAVDALVQLGSEGAGEGRSA